MTKLKRTQNHFKVGLNLPFDPWHWHVAATTPKQKKKKQKKRVAKKAQDKQKTMSTMLH